MNFFETAPTPYKRYKRIVLATLAIPISVLMSAGVWWAVNDNPFMLLLLVPVLATALLVSVVSVGGCSRCVDAIYGDGAF